MKKTIFSIALIFMLSAIICFGTAEGSSDVTLIGGLIFGMDYQSAVIASGYDTCTATAREQAILDANGIGTSRYLKGKGTIGGFPATVYVFFDQSGKLTQVVYYFQEGTRTHNSKGDGVTAEKETLFLQEYNEVEQMLMPIYGEPFAQIDVKQISGGWSYTYEKKMDRYKTLTPSVFPYQLYTSESISLRAADSKEIAYSILNATQRIISQSDGCIVIEHSRINYTEHFMPVNAYNIHFIGYTHFDNDYSTENTNGVNNNSVGF